MASLHQQKLHYLCYYWNTTYKSNSIKFLYEENTFESDERQMT